MMYQENIQIIKNAAKISIQILKLKMVKIFGNTGKFLGKQPFLVLIDQQ